MIIQKCQIPLIYVKLFNPSPLSTLTLLHPYLIQFQLLHHFGSHFSHTFTGSKTPSPSLNISSPKALL
ncbi:hypothetical protein GLYMA_10G215600v4 [Glycine max]|uniref:Uncharacterized protein n=1 Tax=Glycine max TaxID=3847 RepID=A0A0R0I4G0_SOYBN|nr:hypothetical protein GYH30_028716 [Glycine max]KRH34965.1 hypothetical protein GLYMA_10G215600v4 [Glycine max]